VMPPYCITEDDLDQIYAAIREAATLWCPLGPANLPTRMEKSAGARYRVPRRA